MFRVQKLLKVAPLSSQLRLLSASPVVVPKIDRRIDFQQALADAERVAGSSTSMINLRWVTSQNILNFIVLLRNLSAENNKNSMLQTVAKIIQDNKTDLQFYGLILILMSKVGNVMMPKPPLSKDVDESTGILKHQHTLAEVVETFRVKKILHNEMRNLQMMQKFGSEFSADSDVIFGNKIALLSGDFLSANIIVSFANLSDQETIEMGGALVRDFIESKFIGEHDDQSNPLPTAPTARYEGPFDLNLDEIELTKNFDPKTLLGNPKREWIYRTALDNGSTLGYCCRGVMKAAKVHKSLYDHAYKFGRNFAMTLQAFTELAPYRRSRIAEDEILSLVSAPVLYHLDYDPSIYDEIQKGKSSVTNVNFSKVHEAVLNGPGIEQTRELIKEHGKRALEALEHFDHTDAKETLQNLIYAMETN